jgi:AraC-like DNA-binding protein
MQSKPRQIPVSDKSGVQGEQFFHVNIPSVFAANALCYPEMSGYFDCDAKYCCSRAEHLGLLLMHVTAGRMSVYSWRGEAEMEPGDTVLLETFRPHLYCAAQGTTPCIFWLQFDGINARLLADYLIRQNHGGICFRLSSDFSQRFSHLVIDISKGSMTELQQSARIYELLASMERPKADRTPGQRAVEYMQKHYAEAVHIRDLAAAANLSPSHFGAQFKEEYGISPHQYLIEYRLSIGYNLVSNSSLSVDEIFARIGYSSPSAFISAFARRYGKTPARLRKELAGRVMKQSKQATTGA